MTEGSAHVPFAKPRGLRSYLLLPTPDSSNMENPRAEKILRTLRHLSPSSAVVAFGSWQVAARKRQPKSRPQSVSQGSRTIYSYPKAHRMETHIAREICRRMGCATSPIPREEISYAANYSRQVADRSDPNHMGQMARAMAKQKPRFIRER